MLRFQLRWPTSVALCCATALFLSHAADAQLCATPGKDGPGTTASQPIAGVLNTYYPGGAAAAAGATSITVGTPTAGSAISAGDLLLVLQMQDATIDTSNSSSYGDGSNGRGSTAAQAGTFEFVVAQGPVNSGSVAVLGAGTGGGLVNSYRHAPTSSPRRVFQVIRVPQYFNVTLTGTVTAPAWNGTVGGVVALDVQSLLQLNGQAISVDGLGFRGGGGRSISGGSGHSATDWRRTSTVPFHASKGEGIAGTPRYVYDGASLVDRGAARDDYPGGGYSRGAPGNAGGGGNDSASNNGENSGGGGGGNGGAGGRGGNTWSSNQPLGGLGGAAYAASASRMLMGGGGGAGTSNNAGPGHGARGAGLIFLRADRMFGSGTLSADGDTALASTQDGAGGGGAGGTINVGTCRSGTVSGLVARATGGNGGNASWNPGDWHGPGGGGGGGVVLSTEAITTSLAGGTSGMATTANPYNATTGSVGASLNSIAIAATGAQPGCLCPPVAAQMQALRSYPSQKKNRGVDVAWTATADFDTAGFQLYRHDGEQWTPIDDFQPAQPGRASGWYSAHDAEARPGIESTYALREIDVAGREHLHGTFVRDGSEAAPSALRGRARDAADLQTPSQSARAPGQVSSLAVEVTDEGLIAAPAIDLANAFGVQVSDVKRLIAHSQLRVRNGGSDVPWGWDPSREALYFWAEAPRPASTSRVYAIDFARGSTLRTSSQPRPGRELDLVSTRRRFEDDRFAGLVIAPDPESDYWFSHAMLGGSTPVSLPFELSGFVAQAGDAVLQVDLQGATLNDGNAPHRVEILIDGQLLGEARWSGVAAHRQTLRIAPGLLHDGPHELELRPLAPSSGFDVVYLDGFEFDYQRSPELDGDHLDFSLTHHGTVTLSGFSRAPLVLDVTAPQRPQRVATEIVEHESGSFELSARRARRLIAFDGVQTTAPLLSSASWLRPAEVRAKGGLEATNYLVIAGDADLASAAEPLIDLRQRSGLSTSLWTFDQVIDTFGGERSSSALERLVAEAPRLRYLLLLGDGHFDGRDRFGHGESDLIPPLMVQRHDGLFAADRQLVGNRRIAVGRIPARAAGEAAAAIDKILSWERSGGLTTSFTFLTDDADAAGDFPADAARLAGRLQASSPQIVSHQGDLTATRQQLRELFSQPGSALTYLGHGATEQLMAEAALTTTDLRSDWLPTNEAPPLLAMLSCVTGRFELPATDSLAGRAVLTPEGGATAALATTATTHHRSAALLAELWIVALERARGGARLGDVLEQVRRRYLRRGGDERDLATLHLFGDPALRIR